MGCQVSEVVRCHPEHPLSVFWNCEWVEVDKVLKEWRTPEGVVYIISTKKGNQFKLFYCLEKDTWHIEAI